MKSPWWLPLGVFLAVAVAIMYPAWMGDGQLMLLDLPTADHKYLLLGFLTMAGMAAFTLARSAEAAVLPAYMGGLLYTLNPYTIDRLWSGQWRVLAGYAVAPLLVWLAMGAVRQGGRWRWYGLALAYALLPWLSQHWWLIVTLGGAPVLAAAVWQAGRCSWRQAAWGIMQGAGLWLIVNAPWLWRPGGNGGLDQLRAADSSNFGLVSTLPGGLMGTTIGLSGFWYHPFDFLPGLDVVWLVVIIAIIVLAGLGWWRFMMRQPVVALAAAGVLVVCASVVVLSGWVPATSAISGAMAAIPGLMGLRELTKLSGVLALGYAVLAPVGLSELRAYRPMAIIGLIAIIVTMAPAIGGGGYIKNYTYPAGWAEVKFTLDQAVNRRVVVLPFAGYFVAPWAGDRLIGNQARAYFGQDMLVGTSTGNASFDTRREVDTMLDLSDLEAMEPTHVLILATNQVTLDEQELASAGWRVTIRNTDASLWTK